MAKKLKSSFINMLLSLTLISGILAGLLGLVYGFTKEPIEKAVNEKMENAIRNVAPQFDNSPVSEKIVAEVDGTDGITVFPARKEGKLVGAAVESYTNTGFNGLIKIMVGFDLNGNIKDYFVLQHAETPGLGSKMQDWFRPQVEKEKSLVEKIFGFQIKPVEKQSSVMNKNPKDNNLTVKKDGGEIDAITAATISSRAFIDAINNAYSAFENGIKPMIEKESNTNVNLEGESNNE